MVVVTDLSEDGCGQSVVQSHDAITLQHSDAHAHKPDLLPAANAHGLQMHLTQQHIMFITFFYMKCSKQSSNDFISLCEVIITILHIALLTPGGFVHYREQQ